MMKIELKRRDESGKWHYISTKEIIGIPLADIISREMTRPEACIKVETERGTTIITDDMVHHCYYVKRGYKIMSMREGCELLLKHYGEQMWDSVPEYVEEVFPGSVFIGVGEAPYAP